jgi:hypothetical protein
MLSVSTTLSRSQASLSTRDTSGTTFRPATVTAVAVVAPGLSRSEPTALDCITQDDHHQALPWKR